MKIEMELDVIDKCDRRQLNNVLSKLLPEIFKIIKSDQYTFCQDGIEFSKQYFLSVELSDNENTRQ